MLRVSSENNDDLKLRILYLEQELEYHDQKPPKNNTKQPRRQTMHVAQLTERQTNK